MSSAKSQDLSNIEEIRILSVEYCYKMKISVAPIYFKSFGAEMQTNIEEPSLTRRLFIEPH